MSNKNDYNYKKINNPYNNLLERVGSNYSENGDSVVQSPNEVMGSVVDTQSFNNLWISSWIKSRSYKPKVQGFLIDGRRGYIECMQLYVGSGGIVGGKIDIPDLTSASSFHVSSTGDTWWGSDASSFSSAPVRITSAGDITVTGGSITGATITGGLIRTATSGARVEITGNDAYFYDATTGGGGSISGDVASVYFPRTDNVSERFVMQKRAGVNDDDENVMEFFYDEAASGTGGYNYIFMGRAGDASKYYTDSISLDSNDVISIGSTKLLSNKTSELKIFTNESLGEASSWNSGGTRTILSFKQTTTAADYNFSTGAGGGALFLGMVDESYPAGAYNGLAILDQSAFWFDTDLLPQPSTTHNLGNSSYRWNITYSQELRIYGGSTYYGVIDDASGYFNIASQGRNIRLNAGSYTVFVSGDGIAPTSSGSGTCGLSSNYWSNVYSNNYSFSTSYLNYASSAIRTHTHFGPSSARIYNSGTSSLMWSNVYTDAVQFSKSGETTRYMTMNSSGNLECNTGLFVGGTLSKSSGTFTIDHPLKPDTHYLQHSFVESPDMLNVYRGNAVISSGECVITMPDWFSPLNGENQDDYSYQLTSIGQKNNLWVEQEMIDGLVTFAGEFDGKFSYLITAIRHDVFAENNRVEVEVLKTAEEKSTRILDKDKIRKKGEDQKI